MSRLSPLTAEEFAEFFEQAVAGYAADNDHLYIVASYQGCGIGASVLAWVFAQADAMGLAVRVGALRESDSNRFYRRHGFTLVEQAEFDNHYVRPASPAPCLS